LARGINARMHTLNGVIQGLQIRGIIVVYIDDCMEHVTASCEKLTGLLVLRYTVNVVATEFYWVKSFCATNFFLIVQMPYFIQQ
jgi:hypothetical protein